jgi:hypothetical protein
MPMLSRAQLSYGPEVELRFETTSPVMTQCDTAVIQVIATGRAELELSIRFERGRLADFHIWDARARRRHRVCLDHVRVEGSTITCAVPAFVVMRVSAIPDLRATFVVNGGLVQPHFPVAIALTAVPHAGGPTPRPNVRRPSRHVRSRTAAIR